MEAKEPFVEYVAQPQVLNISILKKGIIEVLENFAKMNLIRINQEEPNAETPKKGFGCLKGQIWMADDFNKPLDCFKEYATATFDEMKFITDDENIRLYPVECVW
ncbi:MAG: DUF2281 domain-containing protein [Fibromonadales bacterium]|nr:DUF2281 domain-containing protein [Fibromonadales bacterium]